MKRTVAIVCVFMLLILGVSSCKAVKWLDGPYWKVSLKFDKKAYNRACYDYPTPVNVEYSYPDFIPIGDTVVFRFFDKRGGFKLQIPNVGPFIYGRRYEFKGDERYFAATFDFIKPSDPPEAVSGWVRFNQSIVPSMVAYTVDFEFDVVGLSGYTGMIKNGLFTVHTKVEPKNMELGLTKK